jgi:hypothetical protein
VSFVGLWHCNDELLVCIFSSVIIMQLDVGPRIWYLSFYARWAHVAVPAGNLLVHSALTALLLTSLLEWSLSPLLCIWISWPCFCALDVI